jgi:hypothetical protein
MSKLGQLRQRLGYETNVPRCETCMNFKKPYVYLTTNSKPARSKALCKAHQFMVQPNACCDKWAGSDGSILLKDKK